MTWLKYSHVDICQFPTWPGPICNVHSGRSPLSHVSTINKLTRSSAHPMECLNSYYVFYLNTTASRQKFIQGTSLLCEYSHFLHYLYLWSYIYMLTIYFFFIKSLLVNSYKLQTLMFINYSHYVRLKNNHFHQNFLELWYFYGNRWEAKDYKLNP